MLNANLTVNSYTVLCELHWPKKFYKQLSYGVESLDQKILLLFGQEYHPPRFLLLQHRNAQQSEHQVPLEIQTMINKFVFVERCRFIFGFKR